MWLINYCQTHDDEIVSVVSETFPHLKRGAMRDFENIMRQNNYFVEGRWNKTDSIYTFETGTKLEFFSADQPEKVRGPRRDVLFINEANNIPYNTYDQLEIRTRKIIWLDWNPVAEFWWYTDVAPFTKHDFIKLTYRDNEAMDPVQREALEAHKDNPNKANWWRVYGEGLLGEAEGRVYTGWVLVDEVPRFARLEGYGLDFGYTNDPSAAIAIYKYNEGYILDELFYRKGMSNKEIADTFLNLPKALVIADSAEPKSIDEVKSYGVNIIGSAKGRGSVSQGVQFVQNQVISVTKQSTNLIKEYRNYLFVRDRMGKLTNEPAPVMNHCMDAVRYGLSKYFVDTTPEYHPPDTEKLRELGIESPAGGVGWNVYQSTKGE